MNRPIRFLILANMRTGSTLLASLLDAHPLICCEGEVFASGCDAAIAHRHLRIRVNQTSAAAYGFNLRLGHVQNATQKYSHRFVEDLVEDGWRVLYLHRKNVLRHALSRMVAQHHARWHQTMEEALPAVHVNFRTLMATIKRFEVTNALYAQVASSLPHLPVNYETDLLHPSAHQATVDRICRYLEIPTASVSTSLRPSTARELADVIANHAEITESLASTRYARYL